MARINTYATDNNITAQDKWIGTDSNGNVTKNFTPEGVANWINSTNSVGIAGQSNFKFQTDLGTGRQNGTISFDAGSGDGTLFSTVNDIKISKYGADGNLILDFLQNLVGTFILLCQVDDTNNFGVYRLDSLTQDEVETDFYTAVLTVYGSNGTLQTDEYYGVVAYPGSSIVSVTGLEAIDEGNGVGWRLIGRDPDNYGNIGPNAIDFSNSDSISTERGSTGSMAVTFGYNNINQQTGSIVLGQNVSAKITDIYQGSNVIAGYNSFVWGAAYSSFIGVNRSTIGVEGTNYTTNALYQNLIIGDGLNYYAGRDSGAVGGGLISGSTGCFTVGIANEDLTTTTSNWLTAQYNNYGPRFIVGCGTYTPTTGVAGVRQNGFVVMSDGTATFPIGNVGIGTTSPSEKLHVAGSLLVEAGTSTPYIKGNALRVSDSVNGAFGTLTLGSVNNIVGDVGHYSFKNGTTTLMRIANTGNVGIGTTFPIAKLHVEGGDIYAINNGGDPRLVLGDSVSTGGWGYVQWKSSSDRIDIGTSGTPALSVKEDGNVGIGTTSPFSNLEVVGGASGYLMRVRGTNTFNVYDAGSFSIGLGSGSGQELKLFSNDSLNNGMTISTSGNVGIGTTSPTSKLQIVETGTIAAALLIDTARYGAAIVGDGTSNSQYLLNLQSNGGSTEVMRVQSSGNVGIGTTSPSEKLDIEGGGSTNLKISNTLNSISLILGAQSTAARLTAGTGNRLGFGANNTADQVTISTSGNVGIGTTGPSDKLHIIGSTNTRAIIETQTNGGSSALRLDANPNYWEIKNYGPSAYLGITRGNSEYITIDNSGKVGIGTTSPAYKLTVQGDAYVYGGNLHLPSSTYGIVNAANISQKISFPSLGNFAFENVNVGIGTTSPTAVLDVLSTDAQRYAKFRAPNGEERFYFYIGGTGNSSVLDMFQHDGTTIGIKLSSAGNSYFNGGNVGIGTTSPSEKLDVDGNIKLGATTGRQLMFGENKYGAIRLGNNTVIGGNQAVDIRTGNASVSSQSSRVFINQTGFVGVGTTTPIATLDVNGPIKMGGSLLAPAANTVGAMRYRADSNNSYVEMIMQTGASTYAWVVIQQNTW